MALAQVFKGIVLTEPHNIFPKIERYHRPLSSLTGAEARA
ncbi:hypothetical protein SAMN02982922_3054 [Mesorhizobium australicum]|uniref:Uncharacterized protein n=1 Tax=Mesorhizobium australicum TaxID=536018 RepID=A0A1X7P3B0_9HYPH|nr:hypothetical protein SAMN02982922_3054 [Mesorhizobium australicum]